MGCDDEKLSKYLTHTFMAHCHTMICQQVTLSGEAEWPKVADAVIEAHFRAAPAARGGARSGQAPLRGGRLQRGFYTHCKRPCRSASTSAQKRLGPGHPLTRERPKKKWP